MVINVGIVTVLTILSGAVFTMAKKIIALRKELKDTKKESTQAIAELNAINETLKKTNDIIIEKDVLIEKLEQSLVETVTKAHDPKFANIFKNSKGELVHEDS